MKQLICTSLAGLAGTVALVAVLALAPQRLSAQSRAAQLSDKEIAVSEFNSLNVSDDFEVTLSRGPYGVRLTVDKDLAPYVEVYVKAKTLYLSYDEKAVPKELKKQYRGRNGLTPVFRVVAYTPELRSVSLEDNASFIGVEEFVSPDFDLTATGKSQVKNLSVSANSARINLKKNARATLSIRSQRGVEVTTDNNANVKLTSTGSELTIHSEGSSIVVASGPSEALNIESSGSSQVTVTSDTQDVNLTTEGSSKVVLSGKALSMKVKGSRSSTVDAYSLPIEEVVADLAGSSNVTVSVSKKADVTLVGGSALYYSGSPEFTINKIVKSTLAPYGTR